MGPVLGATGFILAFGLVWHIWWLVIIAALTALGAMISRGFARNITRIIPASAVEEEQLTWLSAVHTATAISRADESNPANQGLADQDAARVGL